MHVEGETKVYMTLNGVRKQIRAIISKEMREDMLISRNDLKTFKVIPQGFPYEVISCNLADNDDLETLLTPSRFGHFGKRITIFMFLG